MGFARIGQFFTGALRKIGNINVGQALNRIGAVASVAHKVGSLINASTGGGLHAAASNIIGSGASNAIAKGTGYIGRAYDSALMTRAAMTAPGGPVVPPSRREGYGTKVG